MTLGDYIVAAENEYRDKRRVLRKGQSYWNTLASIRADLAESVAESDIDPYYNDRALPDFFAFLSRNWGEDV